MTDPRPESPKPLRLAIVDDHEVLLEGLAGWIRSHAPDFELVVAASTWAELIHSVDFPTDVVFLDVQLRETISIEARIRTCRAAGAAVIVLSGLDTEETRDRVLAAGALAFLAKSLPMAEVLREVRSALGRSASGLIEPPRVTGSSLVVPAPRPKLSESEEQALVLYSQGLTVQEVAARMEVQYETAKTYLRRVRQKYTKLGRAAGRRAELIVRAAEDGLLE